MRVQVGHDSRNGDEKLFFVEFDEGAGYFSLITVSSSRNGDEALVSSVPLHKANGQKGYSSAIEWIRNNVPKNKKRKEYKLDSSKFVQIIYGSILPPRLKVWPNPLISIRTCLESAIHMASQIDDIDYGLSSARPDRVRAAYFRASLTELCRVEDAAKEIDKKISFYKSDDPSLHLVKLLRNYQVHISATQLSAGKTQVIFSGEIMDHHSFIAENVTGPQLRLTGSSDGYSDEQLCELATLFDQQQRKLGVVQLLYYLALRVEEYALGVLNPPNAKPARKPRWPS